MSMEIARSYANYSAYSGKKAEKTTPAEQADVADKNEAYLKTLSNKFPSLKLEAGSSITMENDRKISFKINPALLEKMQNDPNAEKHAMELLEGAVQARKLVAAIHKATGWEYEFAHDYIDENGQYWHCAVVKNTAMLDLSDKLRKKNREDAEKRINDSIEKTREKRKELSEKLSESKEDKPEKAEKSVMITARSKNELIEKMTEKTLANEKENGSSVDIKA